jgi:hypothetical protein
MKASHTTPENPFPDIVVIEFQDVIDFTPFPPRQVQAVVEDYLEEGASSKNALGCELFTARESGCNVRLFARSLARASHVIDFRDAPPEAGGWGATPC